MRRCTSVCKRRSGRPRLRRLRVQEGTRRKVHILCVCADVCVRVLICMYDLCASVCP